MKPKPPPKAIYVAIVGRHLEYGHPRRREVERAFPDATIHRYVLAEAEERRKRR